MADTRYMAFSLLMLHAYPHYPVHFALFTIRRQQVREWIWSMSGGSRGWIPPVRMHKLRWEPFGLRDAPPSAALLPEQNNN
jgi:hypothetical protein